MKKSKKVFIVFALLFFAIMVYIGYDISSRTTFPGSKPQLKERLMGDEQIETAGDTAKTDSVSVEEPI